MADDSLSIRFSNKINFKQEMTFENFVGQFQESCPMILCIINGTILHYYQKGDNFPNDISFDYKHKRGEIMEYYFRDNTDETLYCIFGRKNALSFYPKLSIYDQEAVKPVNKPIIEPMSSSNDIIINDRGTKLIFSNPNYPVEIRRY